MTDANESKAGKTIAVNTLAGVRSTTYREPKYNTKLKPGDVVAFKTGGPPMVVERFGDGAGKFLDDAQKDGLTALVDVCYTTVAGAARETQPLASLVILDWPPVSA